MPTSETVPDNLAGIIVGHAAEKVAIISRGRPTTYGELVGQVRRFRGGLQGIGVYVVDGWEQQRGTQLQNCSLSCSCSLLKCPPSCTPALAKAGPPAGRM